jgi:Skp family chaperone for outer membrane proteins
MKTLIALAAPALILAAGPALAQATAPAAQPLGGPAVPGVCLLSQQAVLANAKIGQAATARLKQIADAADAEIAAARTPIEADAKALQSQAAGLKPAELQTRQQALAARVQTLQQTAEQRRREIELTREKAVAEIAGDAQPVIAAVYKAHACGLLVDRNSVLGGNMSGDLTPDVVKGLDAKITTITFERAALPAQTAAAAPAAVTASR